MIRAVSAIHPTEPRRTSWAEPRRGAILGRDEIHVWKADVDLDERAIGPLVELLSPQEMGRANRFRFDRDRARFIVRRALLRTLVGHSTRRRPADLVIVTNAWGKPMLSGHDGACIQFSVSHSDSVVILALTSGREVGVDVERIRHIPECLAMARRFLAAKDVEALCALDGLARSRAFLLRWTETEALLKARGVSLAGYLDAASSLDGGPGARSDGGSTGSSWSLAAFDAGDDALGSVASLGSAWKPVYLQTPKEPEDWPSGASGVS